MFKKLWNIFSGKQENKYIDNEVIVCGFDCSAEEKMEKIKVEGIPNPFKYIFEIDLNDKRIITSTPIEEDNKSFVALKEKLSPSFKYFVSQISNGIEIGIGNLSIVLPIRAGINPYDNIESITSEIINDDLFPSKDFIFFGRTGVDGEKYAFYTGIKLKNGEYPIVWYTPGSIDTEPFVLLNSSFDRFITIQSYLLRVGDLEESSVPESLLYGFSEETRRKYEQLWQEFHDFLYEKFDPAIGKLNANYYYEAVSFDKLLKQIELINE